MGRSAGVVVAFVMGLTSVTMMMSPSFAGGSLDGTYRIKGTDFGCTETGLPTGIPPIALPTETFTVIDDVISGHWPIASDQANYHYSANGITEIGKLDFNPTIDGVDVTGTGKVIIQVSGVHIACGWATYGSRISTGTSGGSGVPTPPVTPSAPPAVVPAAQPSSPPTVSNPVVPPAPPASSPTQDNSCHEFTPGAGSAMDVCVPNRFSASATPGTKVETDTSVVALSGLGTVAPGSALVTSSSMASVSAPAYNSSMTLGPDSSTTMYTGETKPGVLEELVCPASGRCAEHAALAMAATATVGLAAALAGAPVVGLVVVGAGLVAVTNGVLTGAKTHAEILASATGLAVAHDDPVMTIRAQANGSWFYDYEGRYRVIDRASGATAELSPGQSVFLPSSWAAAALLHPFLGVTSFDATTAPRWWSTSSGTSSSEPWWLPLALSWAGIIILYFLIFFLTRKRRARRRGEPPQSSSSPAVTAPLFVADELAKLAQLRDQGLLTTEEFESQKVALLHRPGAER